MRFIQLVKFFSQINLVPLLFLSNKLLDISNRKKNYALAFLLNYVYKTKINNIRRKNKK